MTTPPLERFTQLPALVQHSWDAWPLVDGALRELEVGQFATPALLADALLTDDRVSGVLATRVNGLLGLPLEFAAQEPSGKAAEILRQAEEALPEMLPENSLASMLSWGILHGVSVGELLWERSADLWMPRLRVWHNQWLFWRWDAADPPEKQLWLITENGTVQVTPGDGHWVLHAPYGHYFGWLRGLIRPLARLWLDRLFVFRDWARRSERNGLGITKGIVPETASDASKKTFSTGLRNLASESTILCPSIDEKNRFDVEMLDTKEHEGTTSFAEHIKQLDTSIAVCMLGQNLTTEVRGGGSRAAAQVHENVRRDFLRSDAATLSATLYRQVYIPWVRVNWGDEALAPMPRWNVEPPADRKEAADAFAQLANALVAFQQAGAPIDVRSLLDEQDVPLLEEASETEPGREQLSARTRRKPRGALRGRLYSEAVADHAKRRGVSAGERSSEALLRIVGEAKDLADLRERLAQAFGELDPDELARLTEKALLMSELAGRHGLLEDA